MLKLIGLLVGAAMAQTATSPSYLIFPSLAACQARSQQMCQAMGCDGVHSIYWWACIPLNAGTIGPTAVPAGSYAMRVEANGRFGVSSSNLVSNGTQGLTVQEQSQLNTATDVNPLIPPSAVR